MVLIRVEESSRISLRNCHFLRKAEFQTTSSLIPSSLPEPTGSASDVPVTHSSSPIPSTNDTHERHLHVIIPLVDTTHAIKNSSRLLPCIIFQALKNFLPLVGTYLHTKRKDVGTKGNFLPCSRLYKCRASLFMET